MINIKQGNWKVNAWRHTSRRITVFTRGIKLLFVSTLSQWGSVRFSFYN